MQGKSEGSKRTQFKKGQGGRKKGTPNKLTKTIREKVLEVFNTLQDEPDGKSDLISWAKAKPGEFYPIAAKLIPTEMVATVTERVIKVVRE